MNSETRAALVGDIWTVVRRSMGSPAATTERGYEAESAFWDAQASDATDNIMPIIDRLLAERTPNLDAELRILGPGVSTYSVFDEHLMDYRARILIPGRAEAVEGQGDGHTAAIMDAVAKARPEGADDE